MCEPHTCGLAGHYIRKHVRVARESWVCTMQQDAARELTNPSRRFAAVANRLAKVASARVLILASHCDQPGARRRMVHVT